MSDFTQDFSEDSVERCGSHASDLHTITWVITYLCTATAGTFLRSSGTFGAPRDTLPNALLELVQLFAAFFALVCKLNKTVSSGGDWCLQQILVFQTC